MSELRLACRHRFDSGFELNVEFESRGRVTALFGPSGSGKTTVLSILAGSFEPDFGRVEISGRVVLDTERGVCLPPDQRWVGKVFQDQLLFPHLTVEKNLRFGRQRAGSDPAIKWQRVIRVLELDNLLDRLPATLSGGQRQRVAIGRALLSGPRLLVLDEPLVALDRALKYRIVEYLERVVNEWSVPILFVSHSTSEVRRLAEHVVVLEQGRRVAHGTPEQAFGEASVLGWSNASSPVNLLLVEDLSFRDHEWQGRVGGQPLILPGDPGAGLATAVYVQFSPNDVVLSLDRTDRVSARNRLVGTVERLVETDRRFFVAIDVGQTLWTEVTRESVSALGLRSGLEIVCMIKTSRLEMVGPARQGDDSDSSSS